MSSSHPTANAQQQLESEIASIRFCGGDEVSDDETARTESSEVHAQFLYVPTSLIYAP